MLGFDFSRVTDHAPPSDKAKASAKRLEQPPFYFWCAQEIARLGSSDLHRRIYKSLDLIADNGIER